MALSTKLQNNSIGSNYSYLREEYQKANETHDVKRVRELNALGYKPKVPPFSGPTIATNFMDIATKFDAILSYIQKLRAQKRFVTIAEFKAIADRPWKEKRKLNRLMGADFLTSVIAQNQLKHIKVPLKIAIVKQEEHLHIQGYYYDRGMYNITSEQIVVYAEEITPKKRTLTREEIDELIILIAKANYIDLWPENFILADKGLYVVDTEFKSFANRIEWGKLMRFTPLVDAKDQTYFQQKIRSQRKGPTFQKQSYYHYQNLIEMGSSR